MSGRGDRKLDHESSDASSPGGKRVLGNPSFLLGDFHLGFFGGSSSSPSGSPLPLEKKGEEVEDKESDQKASELANLGYVHLSGLGVKKEISQAKLYFLRTAKQYPLTLYGRWAQGMFEWLHANKIHSLQILATQNFVPAINAIGEYHLSQQDFLTACQFFERAIEQDPTYAVSHYHLYECYLKKGKKELAQYHLKQAADLKFAPAQCQLGVNLLTEQKIDEATSWLELAEKQGYRQALVSLGTIYESKCMSAPSLLSQAFECYRSASEFEIPEAKLNLARCFELGLGVSRDPAKAVEIYQAQAYLGDPKAMLALMECYKEGRGVSQNTLISNEWFCLSQKEFVLRMDPQEDKALGESKEPIFVTSRFRPVLVGVPYKQLSSWGVDCSKVKTHPLKWCSLKELEQFSLSSDNNLQAYALARLGYAYFLGKEVKADPTKANQYLMQAATLHSTTPHGMWAKGTLEYVVTRNIGIWTYLVELNYAPALISMGDYEDSRYKSEESLSYYEEARQQGYEDAIVALGIYHYTNRSFTQSTYALLSKVCKAHGLKDEYGTQDVGRHAQQAFNFLITAANFGNPQAQYLFGNLFEHADANLIYDIDVRQDLKVARMWYMSAATQGHALSQIALGKMMEIGLSGIEAPNPQEAFKWYQAASDQGSLEGQFEVARCLDHGIGTSRDSAKALERYERLAASGHIPSTTLLDKRHGERGEAFLSGESKTESKEAVKPKKQWPVTIAELKPALALPGGSDDDRALCCYAFVSLGRMCWEGAENIEEDKERALNLLGSSQLVFEKNDLSPKLWGLGYLFYLAKDYEQAVYCWTRLAEKNYAPAQWSLFECFEQGLGCKQDPEKAFDYLNQAAQGGYAIAQHDLAERLEEDKDFKSAEKWYLLAAEQGYGYSQTNLANMYEEGSEDVPKDMAKAKVWHEKAAAQDFSVSQIFLGKCCEEGIGCPEDKQKALDWYCLAAWREPNINKKILELEKSGCKIFDAPLKTLLFLAHSYETIKEGRKKALYFYGQAAIKDPSDLKIKRKIAELSGSSQASLEAKSEVWPKPKGEDQDQRGSGNESGDEAETYHSSFAMGSGS